MSDRLVIGANFTSFEEFDGKVKERTNVGFHRWSSSRSGVPQGTVLGLQESWPLKKRQVFLFSLFGGKMEGINNAHF